MEKGYTIPTCVRCDTEYNLRDGCEETMYCDPCAQEVAVELLEALEDIAEPMRKIQAEARADGLLVNGAMANSLCQDANWLRDKARTALRKAKGLEGLYA